MIDGTKTFSSFAVKDLAAAEEFYGQTLGLSVKQDENMGLLQLDIGSGKQVMIYPKPDHEPATYTVLNFPVNDIDAAVDELTKKGVEFITYDSEWIKTDEKGIARSDGKGPNIAWFTDPAGNILSVIEADPSQP